MQPRLRSDCVVQQRGSVGKWRSSVVSAGGFGGEASHLLLGIWAEFWRHVPAVPAKRPISLTACQAQGGPFSGAGFLETLHGFLWVY